MSDTLLFVSALQVANVIPEPGEPVSAPSFFVRGQDISFSIMLIVDLLNLFLSFQGKPGEKGEKGDQGVQGEMASSSSLVAIRAVVH